ncbi:hypothetical protein UFOVP649_69 [uncultured Caudovirales phage]|uniref:Uncharacterized protein n=1 Tax=uncultured Caudovirales phage TaxID=2100421 RepID=A0A6J5N9A3_9CAUD|nr:hypothetical protein UFOVP649_69 [uncultured Caudovirales phage]
MINQTFPITPPPELVKKLQDLGNLDAIELACQAGADQELEACAKWLTRIGYPVVAMDLLSMRRPKPLGLKEKALKALCYLQEDEPNYQSSFDTIRRALEQLND